MYSVAVVKSLRWPGAYTVSKGGKPPCNIYIGDGIKKGDTAYNPTAPPEVMDDPVDQEEQPEPTPLTEPVAQPEAPADDPPADD